jgi:hypothetical protein
MNRFWSVMLVVVGLMLAVPAASEASDRSHRHGFHSHRHGFHRHVHRHHGFRHSPRVFVSVGPSVWWGPRPYWAYPYPHYYYPPAYYVYSPPPVVVQEPPVYVQQQQAAAAPQTETYWYYCPSAQGYYPAVQTCSEPWVRVPPRPQ